MSRLESRRRSGQHMTDIGMDDVQRLVDEAKMARGVSKHAALGRARVAAEAICTLVANREIAQGPPRRSNESFEQRIAALRGLLPDPTYADLKVLQIYGNIGSHGSQDTDNLSMAHRLDSAMAALSSLVVWLRQRYPEAEALQPPIDGYAQRYERLALRSKTEEAVAIHALEVELARVARFRGSPSWLWTHIEAARHVARRVVERETGEDSRGLDLEELVDTLRRRCSNAAPKGIIRALECVGEAEAAVAGAGSLNVAADIVTAVEDGSKASMSWFSSEYVKVWRPSRPAKVVLFVAALVAMSGSMFGLYFFLERGLGLRQVEFCPPPQPSAK